MRRGRTGQSKAAGWEEKGGIGQGKEQGGRQKPWLTGQDEQQQAGQYPGGAAGIPGMRLHRCGERSPRLHSAAPRPARRLGFDK